MRLLLSSGRSSTLATLARHMAVGTVTLTLCAPLWAGPEGESVVKGSAHVERQGKLTNITAANGAMITWNTFNINQGETVRFLQPDSGSRVYNFVTGNDPSVIAGTLQANGIVYLFNSAGIYFREGALVNVGQIYAAAGHIAPADLANGVDHFTNLSGAVVNEGTINAAKAVLVGNQVINAGTINTPNGVTVLASGNDVLLGEYGGRIFARIANGNAPATAGTGVENSGNINARGGQAILAAGDIFSTAIFHRGTTAARDITVQGGARGTVRVEGGLDASQSAPGSRGGEISVTGERVEIADATLDASGQTAGGRIRVGGDFRGTGDLARAQTTIVNNASVLRADSANTDGQGGQIIVWSDNITGFYGSASVNGGVNGQGGFIETSSANALDIRGARITARGSAGNSGTWLLDPRNLVITNSGDPVSGVYEPTVDDASVDVNSIKTFLEDGVSGGNVELRTFSLTGTQAGNIDWQADLNVNLPVARRLTLRAANNITIGGALAGSITATGNALTVELFANDGGGTANPPTVNNDADPNRGDIIINRAIVTNGGDLFIGSRAAGDPRNPLNTLGTTNITINANAALSTGAGSINVRGVAINIQSALQTTSGAINIDAFADPAATLTTQIQTQSGGTLTTSGGSVTILPSNIGQVIIGGGISTSGGNIDIGNSASTALTQIQAGAPLNAGAGFIRLGSRQVQVQSSLTTNNNSITLGNANATLVQLLSGGSVSTSGGALNVTAGAGSTVAVNDTVTTGAGTVTILGGNIGISRLVQTTSGQIIVGDANTTNINLSGGGLGGLTTSGAAVRLIDAAGAATVTLGANIATSNGNVTIGSAANTGAFGLTSGFSINSGTGSVSVRSGALTLGGSIATNNGAVSLITNGSSPLTVNATASVLTNGGSLALGNAASTGAITVNSGAVLGSNANRLGQVDILGGTITLSTPLFGSSGQVTIGSSNTNSGTLTIGGAITTSGGGVSILPAGTAAVAVNAPISTGAGNVLIGNLTSNGSVSIALGAPITTTGSVTLRSNPTLSTFFVSIADSISAGSVLVEANRIQLSLGSGRSIQTTGDQTYAFASSTSGAAASGIELLLDASLTSTAGAITLSATDVGGNGTVRGARTLTINAATSVALNTLVGVHPTASLQLADLVVTAPSITLGNSVTTNNVVRGSGSQQYNGNVILAAPLVTLTTLSNTSTIAFSGTINALSAGVQGLSFVAPGAVTVSGAIGGTTALSSVLSDATGTISLRSVTTTGTQTYNDAGVTLNGTYTTTNSAFQVANAATLAGNTTVSTGSGNATFGSTVDGAFTLAVNSTGLTTFNGALGGTTALTGLSTNAGGTTSLGTGTVNTTNGAVSFGDALTLTANTTISTGSGNISLATADGGFTLTLNSTGATTASGAIGGTTALSSLTTNAGGTSSFASVTTTGAQTYNDTTVSLNGTYTTTNSLFQIANAATLLGNTTVSTGSGNITLNTVNGAFTLALNSTGATTASGAIGGTTALASLTTNAGGTSSFVNVTTTGTQTYNDATVTLNGTYTTTNSAFQVANATTLAGNSTVSTGSGNATFSGTVDGAFTLAVNSSGLTTFNGAIGGTTALAGLSTNPFGSTTLGAGTVNTNNGAVSFGNALALTANTTISAGSGNISLNSVNGAFTLALNSTGATSASNTIGGTTALASLTTNAGGTSSFLSVTTTGAQTYNDTTVSLGGTYTTTNSTIQVTNALLLTNSVNFSNGSGAVNLNTVDGAFGLNIISTGVTTVTGAVGGTTALTTVTTDAGGSSSFRNVTTTGAQSYGDATVTLNGTYTTTNSTFQVNGATTLAGNSTVSTGAGNATFGGTIDGPFTLAVNSTGATAFNGAIGGTTALTGLSTNAGGTTSLGTGTVNTTNGAVSFGDALTLTTNTIISTGSGNISLATADGAFSLTLNSTGATTASGAIGGTTALSSLTTNAGGTSSFANVTTTGTQTYNDAGVTLNGTYTTTNSAFQVANATTLAGNTTVSTGSGNATFGSTVDGAFTLAVNSTGLTTFNGALGGTTALTGLSTNAGGTTSLGTGTVNTTNGAVSFGDALTLTANTTISTGSGNISLATADGGFTLTLNSTGATTASGAIGGTTALSSLTTNAGGTSSFASVTTTGAQTYNDTTVSLNGTYTTTNSLFQIANAATLLGNTTVSTGSGNITLNTVNGAFTLALNSTGATTASGAIGGTTALASLTTNAGGTSSFVNVTTTGTQTYNDATVTLNGTYTTTNSAFQVANATTLAGNSTVSTGSGNATFSGTVDGAFTLAVNSSGLTTFNGAIGGTTALAGLSTNPFGSTTLGAGTVNTNNGAVSFGNALALTANTTISAGSGNISLNSVNGAFTLALNSTGATSASNTIGGTTALASLTTNAGGTSSFLSVTTTGAQTYNDTTVSLGGTYTTTNSTIQVTNALLLTNSVNFSNGSGAVNLNTVDGAFGLNIISTGVTTVTGAVGGTTALTTVTTDAGGSSSFRNVTTTGAQSYGDATVTLNGTYTTTNSTFQVNGATTLAGNSTVSTGAGNATFGGTIDGPFTLAVNSTGATAFNGAIGGTTALTGLSTNAGGTTSLGTGTVNTTNGAVSFGDALTLTTNTIISTGSGNISLATADGAFSLTLNSTGATTASGAIGGTTALSSLTTNAGGTSSFANVTTTGTQTYGDATVSLNGTYTTTNSIFQVTNAAVLLGNTTVSTGSGNIGFNTVDGAFALTLNSTGATTASGAIGGTTALSSLTTNAGGTSSFRSITTAGDQTLNDSGVTLNGTYISSGGQFLVNNGAVTLAGNTTVNAFGNIRFDQNVDGAFSLSTTTLSSTVFASNVGTVTALTGLTTNGGLVTLQNVTTNGAQTYNNTAVRFIGPSYTTNNGLFQVTSGATQITLNNIVINAGSGNVNFGGTVDGITGFAIPTLTVNSTGATVFSGAVGSTVPIAGLTTDAGGTLSILSVTTTGTQTYNDATVTLNGTYTTTNSAFQVTNAATLAGNTTVSTGTGNQSFLSTINATTAGAQSLTLNSTGATTASGAIGGTTALASFTTDAGGTLSLGGSTIGATGAVDIGDNVVLSNNLTVNAASIRIAGTVDADNALNNRNLILNAPGLTQIESAVGATQALGSFTSVVQGTASFRSINVNNSIDIQDNAGITLNGTYTALLGSFSANSFVTLNGNSTFNANTTVNFNGAINGAFSLTSNAPQTTFRNIGTITPLTSLTVNGITSLASGASVTTAGNINLNGALNLTNNPAGSDYVITSNSGTFAVTGAVNGGVPLQNGLTINASSITLGGLVGNVVQLEFLNLNGSLNLLADTTLNLGATTLNLGGVTGNGFSLTITTSGTTDLNGAFTNLVNFTSNGGGLTCINTNLSVSGNFLFSDAVCLGGPVNGIITLSAVNTTFGSTVDSDATGGPSLLGGPPGVTPRGLIVNSSGNGVTSFQGVVGGTNRLLSLATNADGSVNALSVFTVNDINFNELAISLSGTYETISGGFTAAGPVTLAGNTTVNTGNQDITFGNTITGAFALFLNSAGDTNLNGDVSGLASLITDAPGFTNINAANIGVTNGTITFNDSVVLLANTAITAGTGAITFVSTVDGPFTLTTTADTTSFLADVGANDALTSLTTNGGTLTVRSVETTGAQTFANTTRINIGGTYTTSNALVSFTGPVFVDSNSLVNTATGPVTFLSTVDSGPGGARALTVNTSGLTTFTGVIGGNAALSGLTTDAPGNLVINGATANAGISLGAAAISAQGNYNTLNSIITFGGPVTLTGNLTASSGTANTTIQGTVDGAFALTLSSVGSVFVFGDIGATTALASVFSDGGGTSSFVNVTTTGTQIYNDATVTLNGNYNTTNALFQAVNAVVLNNNTTISTGLGNIDLGTVNGAFGLTLNSGGTTTVSGAIGGTTALTSVTTDAPGSSSFASVTTTGAQNYNDSAVTLNGTYTTTNSLFRVLNGLVTLAGNTTISTGSGNIDLLNGVDGAFSLAANSTGVTTFDGTIGGTNAPSITTNAGGSTIVNSTTINVSSLTFNDAAVFNNLSTITSTGTVRFASFVDGPGGLSISAPTIFFDSFVGDSSSLSTLILGPGSTTTFAASVNSSGIVTANNVLIGGSDPDGVLISGTSVTFNGTVNSAAGDPRILGVFAGLGGSVTFGSTVGDTNALAGLVVLSPTTFFGGNVTTTGVNAANIGLAVSGATVLTNDVVFDGGAGRLIFFSTIDSDATARSVTFTTSATGLTPAELPTGLTPAQRLALFRDYRVPILFGGSIGADSPMANVNFNYNPPTRDGRGNLLPPALATIAFANAINTADGSILGSTNYNTNFSVNTAPGGRITVGRNEKMLAFGNLSMTADRIDLSDVTTTGSMSFTAADIRVRSHAPGRVFGFSSTNDPTQAEDEGTSFVAGTSIFFSSNPQNVGPDFTPVDAGPNPSLATPDGNNINVPGSWRQRAYFGGGAGGQADLINEFLNRDLNTDPVALARPIPFIRRAQGPTNDNVSETITPIIVVEIPQIQPGSTLGQALARQLEEIGLFIRSGADPAELIEFLVGRSLYNDKPGATQVNDEDRKTSAGRLSLDQINKLLELTGQLKANSENYRSALFDAAEAYFQANDGKEFDGAAFRDLLMSQDASNPARQCFELLASIYRRVDQLGIGPVEARICKKAIAESVRPENLSSANLLAAFESTNKPAGAGASPTMP
jgi:hypothetical protein